jgi:ribulose-phosphate 3-epimerase
MKVKIAPSILSADFSNLAEEVKRVEEGGADYLHVDVMDGRFVPNISIGPNVVNSIRDKTTLPFDVHLMILEPEKHLNAFAEAGADIIGVSAEACTHLHRTVQNIKKLGKKASVALNPATPLSFIEYVLEDLDQILLMTVNPGFGGQEFIPNVLPKIEKCRQMINDRGLKLDVEVDGGINERTVPMVVKAGANVLVAGSAIYGRKNIKKIIEAFRKAAKS